MLEYGTHRSDVGLCALQTWKGGAADGADLPAQVGLVGVLRHTHFPLSFPAPQKNAKNEPEVQHFMLLSFSFYTTQNY